MVVYLPLWDHVFVKSNKHHSTYTYIRDRSNPGDDGSEGICWSAQPTLVLEVTLL